MSFRPNRRPGRDAIAGGWTRAATALLVGLYVLLAVGDILVHTASQVTFGRLWYGLEGIPSAYVQATAFVLTLGPLMAVGALLALRRPRNPIGWLLCAVALGGALNAFSLDYWEYGTLTADPPPAWTLVAWLSQWLVPLLYVPLGFILLLFPDGRLPSARWRSMVVVGGLVVIAIASQALMPGTLQEHWFEAGPNPFGVPAVEPLLRVLQASLRLTVPVFAIGALSSIAIRFRRSTGTERLQLKWFVLAVGLAGVAGLLALIEISPLPLPVPDTLVWSLPATVPAAIPIAIGVAVLRYRLYDIDRIVSRTVTYGLVVAAMGALYVAGVVGLGAAVAGMTGEQGGDLVVAASVLAVVALFRPVRSRVQRAVDRRFNRTGYQARRAVDAFTEGLREEVDARAIQRDLVATATTLAQPDHLSVWIPDRRAEP